MSHDRPSPAPVWHQPRDAVPPIENNMTRWGAIGLVIKGKRKKKLIYDIILDCYLTLCIDFLKGLAVI